MTVHGVCAAATADRRIPGGIAGDRLLAQRLSDAVSPAAASVTETLMGVMEKARAAGKLREDVTQLDLRVRCGAALQLLRPGEPDPATWRRHGDMVLSALRP